VTNKWIAIDRRVSVGRSRLILHWIDKIPKKNTFQSIFQKVHKNCPSIRWSCISFGASCDGWPYASTTDAAKMWYYVFLSLRDNHDSGVNRHFACCASLTNAMVHCICTREHQLGNFVFVILLLTGRSRVSKWIPVEDKLATADVGYSL